MKSLIVTFFALGVFATASEQSPSPGQQLKVRLYNLAGVTPSVLNSAAAEASAIFARVGVALVWELGDSDAEEAHTEDRSSSAFARTYRMRNPGVRGYVAVRIGRNMSGHTPARALGVSLPDALAGVSSTIFEDRIESLCKSDGLDLAVVLGHVIAHEMGHVLLGSPEHAVTGIMRARWGKTDFDQAAMGLLRFSATQGAAIRNHGSLRESSSLREPSWLDGRSGVAAVPETVCCR
jgi:hypothetical protein